MFRKIRSALEKKGLIRHRIPVFLPYRKEIILSMKRPIDIKKIETSFTNKINQPSKKVVGSIEESISYLLEKKRRGDASNFFVAALRSLYSMDSAIATEFGLAMIHQIPDSRAVRTLVNHLHRNDSHEKIPEILEYVGPSPWKVKIHSALLKGQKGKKINQDKKVIPNSKKRQSRHFTPNLKPAQITRKYSNIKDLKIACILDNFSYSAFKFEAEFLQLSVDSYVSELKQFQPDLFFVESAWRGKDGLWGSKVGHADREVIEILEWCKSKNVPTVFWNKEDPVHFKSFLNVAKLFDYVFTTDMDCIQRYKQALKHGRVYLLPFAFQPKLHNPISEFNRINGVCFAGAYYKKYQERNANMANILSGIQKEINFDIYDRNFLEDNPDYEFPSEFSKHVVGTLQFDEINLAYKGYQIGLNLNTIKNSPTMFARRVFELMASNTLIFSNYSRGIELLFGELVFNSDSGIEILRAYKKMNEDKIEQLKLNGVRNVFSQHTYEHRFRHIISKLSLQKLPILEQRVLAVSIVDSLKEAKRVVSSFENQVYSDCSLFLLKSDKINFSSNNTKITVADIENLDVHFFEEMMIDAEYLTPLHANSSYGPYFIQDMIHSTTYIEGRAITKHIQSQDEDSSLSLDDAIYSATESINPRSVLFPKSMIMNKPVLPNLKIWKKEKKVSYPGFAIDNYNFIQDISNSQKEALSGLNLDTGIPFTELLELSDKITPDEISTEGQYFSSAEIYQQISDSNRENVSIEFTSGKTIIDSTLAQGEFTYLYWHDFMKPSDIGIHGNRAQLYLDATPGLRMMLAVIFYNDKREKIGSNLSLANSNISFEIPLETNEIRLALRIYQQGISEINSLDLFHRNLTPNHILTKERVLIVSNNYPSYEEKYRNGFLHTRLQEYVQNGKSVDMFVLKKGGQLLYREYEGIQVISGSQKALENILTHGSHEKIAVHFLDCEMWETIEPFSLDKEILVWIHGSEIQPWHRRTFNYETDEELAKAKTESQIRMDFWRPLLTKLPSNMKLIFVSEYFAQEVMEDTGVKIPSRSYEIIHNPINTSMFNYVEKSDDQRMKILSIRPFASKKYANDLTVKAILHLSKKKFFKNLEFLIVGDGKLFDEVLEPLIPFDNVTIQRGFLSHSEIAELHKKYGVFLTPTRMDSQGVSRDEAMSSGLVAITTNVTAIPEFVDGDSGVLVPGEDFKAMAKAIENLYHNPREFQSISNSAAKRVRSQTDSKIIIGKELKLLTME